MRQNKFYITTAIDYPNALPHVGTAFEKIGADVQARYRKMAGYDVYFLMGNDENTIKVHERATELSLPAQQYVDSMAEKFRDVWAALDVEFDRFIRTTDEDHERKVREFIIRVHKRKFIYKKQYRALYCEGCEEFKTESRLRNGKCEHHPQRELKLVEEENWFFALSQFEDDLKRLYRENPSFLVPESRRNEVLKQLEDGLEDISISRKNYGWGIPVPFDDTQTIYVWFDALINYITGAIPQADGFEPDFNGNTYWPADVHFIGKDITRFHCLIWPAMLLAADIQLPKQVFAHGFVMGKDGKKEAKSGNATSPIQIVNEYGSDAYRYYFLSRCPYGNDSEFSLKEIREVYNADLANNLGNYVSRVIGMSLKYFGGELPSTGAITNFSPHIWKSYHEAMKKCDYASALKHVFWYLDQLNKHIEIVKPWNYAKAIGEGEGHAEDNLLKIMRSLVNGLYNVAVALAPFMPRTSDKMLVSIGLPPRVNFQHFPGSFDGFNFKTWRPEADEKFPPLFERKKNE